MDADGVVRVGDLVFMADLPATVALAPDFRVGMRLAGGEEVVESVPPAPAFRIPLAPEQQALVPPSSEVDVSYPEGVWVGRVDSVVEAPERGEVDPGYLPLQRLLSNSRGAQPGALAEPRFQRLLARVHALSSR